MEIISLVDTLKKATCLYSKVDVANAISVLANKINTDFAGKAPIVYSVMKGGLVFSGEIISQFTFDMQLDYLHASRYQGSDSAGELQWLITPGVEIAGRDVLILDDIYDQGLTLLAVCEACKKAGAASVEVAVLVNKNHQRKTEKLNIPKYIGLEVDDVFIFGYGMDYNGFLRNAAGIYSIDINDVVSAS